MSREDDAAELADAYPQFVGMELFDEPRLFVEVEPGTFESRLPDHLREGLTRLVDELRALLLTDDRTALRRLYPAAYPNDGRRDEEYASFAHDQLLESRLEGLDIVEKALGEDRLTAEELSAIAQALNELRLVIGTRLDVTEGDPRERDPDGPDAESFRLYRLLAMLVGEIVDSLAPTLPGNPGR